MKRLFLLLLCSVTFIYSANITLSTKLKNTKGQFRMALCADKKSFDSSDKCFRRKVIKPSSKNFSYVFRNIPKGTYAISVYHDENANNKLDFNIFGAPIEGYGFSNNKYFLFRGSTFEEASFKLDKNKKIIIKMNY